MTPFYDKLREVAKTQRERDKEEADARERQKKRADTKEWLGRTMSLIAAEFPELKTRHPMTQAEQLQEAISKCRWLEDVHGGSHASWQASVEHSVRTWDEKKHRALHDYLASYAWADQVEGTPQHLREQAAKMRLMSKGEKERLSQEAAEQRQLEMMREQAAEEEAKKKRAAQARAEMEAMEAAAKLEADVEELLLMDERDAVGGGSW